MTKIASTWLARLLVLTAMGAGVLLAPPAAAEDGSGELLLIMDVSGSMERKDASGTSLIQGARDAVRDFVAEVPADTEIGLRFYGSDYAGDARARGCKDTRLAVPIGPASETGSKITTAVDGVRPTGFTPIGYSLTQAAGDFSAEGARSIILVSDGEDTCGNPAPCKAAKELAKSGIELRVDTVGLFLQDNPAARKQLECIADATGGTYVPADDAAALGDQLSAVSSRAIARFQAAGEAVDGGPSLTEAVPIEAGTTYVDDVLNGEARWYSLDVQEGQQVTVTATDDGSVDYGCCVNYAFLRPDGTSRMKDHGYNESGTANTYILDGETFASGTHYFRVTLDDTTRGDEYDGPLSYEFTVEVTDPAGAETETASPSASPTAAATEATDETAAAAAETGDADDSGGGVPALLWVLVGVLVLAVLGLGGMVLVLMRKVAARD